nr:putative transmembrane protein (PGPGW) [uncultured bacterium]ALS91512.1 putative transmembrane protein (PGPGW) [uncultured bacterium]
MLSLKNVKMFAFEPGSGTMVLAGRPFRLPKNRPARIAIGILLIIGGIFSFLPVLGLWMLPLGLLVLSQDVPAVRRWRRRLTVRWTRWRQSRGSA